MFLVVYYYYSVAREKVLFHYYFPSTYPMMDRFTAPNFLIKMLRQIFVRFCDDFAFGWKFVAFFADNALLKMLGGFGKFEICLVGFDFDGYLNEKFIFN